MLNQLLVWNKQTTNFMVNFISFSHRLPKSITAVWDNQFFTTEHMAYDVTERCHNVKPLEKKTQRPNICP